MWHVDDCSNLVQRDWEGKDSAGSVKDEWVLLQLIANSCFSLLSNDCSGSAAGRTQRSKQFRAGGVKRPHWAESNEADQQKEENVTSWERNYVPKQEVSVWFTLRCCLLCVCRTWKSTLILLNSSIVIIFVLLFVPSLEIDASFVWITANNLINHRTTWIQPLWLDLTAVGQVSHSVFWLSITGPEHRLTRQTSVLFLILS